MFCPDLPLQTTREHQARRVQPPRSQGSLIINGFDYAQLPMEPAIEAFETLANRLVPLSPAW